MTIEETYRECVPPGNVVHRVSYSIRHDGVRATLAKLYGLAVDYWFDFHFGLDTCAWSELDQLTVRGASKADGNRYQPARILPFRKLLRTIQTELPPNPVLVDFGSGKGRILLVAAEFGFRNLHGVEFAHELYQISSKNCLRFKVKTGIKVDFQIEETDAAVYSIRPEENVFVFYNPFHGSILSRVLDNIVASLRTHPRKILIIYFNPRWNEVISERQEFVFFRELIFWGFQFNLYTNRGWSECST